MTRYFKLLIAILVMVSVAGCGGDIAPGSSADGKSTFKPTSTAVAELVKLPVLHEAVGTVKAKTGVSIEAQVTGRVLQVPVRPGKRVKKGEVLVQLDSRSAESRLAQAKQGLLTAKSGVDQAKQAVSSAKAAFLKAEATYRRMKKLYDEKVVTADEKENAETALLQARAGLKQAQDALAGAESQVLQAAKVVQEAEIGLGYTTITAPVDGEVVKRLAEPGDLAFPGKVLLTLQTSGKLRLEAQIREGLISGVRIGQRLTMDISALGGPNQGRVFGVVEEIEPSADPITRTFVVKVGLPDLPGLFPGMFGRLLVPAGEEQGVLIPASAVYRAGQLETVMIKNGTGWMPVHVRTGQLVGDKVVVLSGLSGGETVAIGGVR